MSHDMNELLAHLMDGYVATDEEILAIADQAAMIDILRAAASLRDLGHAGAISYSRKVFIPLTHLCRDVCHYCTFAQVPRKVKAPYLTPDEVLKIAADGAKAGCKEALFTLGDKPELRYKAAREALATLGFETTLEYVGHGAGRVLKETGVLPHINAGNLSEQEITYLRKVSGSMGIMLESASKRLCEKGMPHYLSLIHI